MSGIHSAFVPPWRISADMPMTVRRRLSVRRECDDIDRAGRRSPAAPHNPDPGAFR